MCARVSQAGCRRTFWGGDCTGRNMERDASSSGSKSVSRTYPASHTQQEEEGAAVAVVDEEGAAAPHLEEEAAAAAAHWGSPWSSDAESCSACNVVANLNLAFEQQRQQHSYNFCDAQS